VLAEHKVSKGNIHGASECVDERLQIYAPSRTTRRPHTRAEGTYWNSTNLACVRKTHGVILGDYVEDDYEEEPEEIKPVHSERYPADVCAICDSHTTRNGYGASLEPVVLDSLLDIAKPAKLKGAFLYFCACSCDSLGWVIDDRRCERV
jgi:hypothetical protein